MSRGSTWIVEFWLVKLIGRESEKLLATSSVAGPIPSEPLEAPRLAGLVTASVPLLSVVPPL